MGVMKNQFTVNTKKAKIIFMGCVIFCILSISIYNSLDLHSLRIPKRKAASEKEQRKNKIYSKEALNNYVFKMNYSNKCSFKIDSIYQADIEMSNIFKDLTLKESYLDLIWNKEYRAIDYNRWNSTAKLEVFIILHAHNDPGWLYTFDNHYQSFSGRILDNMLLELPLNPNRKFIWSEISFFSLWYRSQNVSNKNKVKRLISRNQLEFVTGGWVINDEAATHWLSTVQQLTQGHQWLKENLNYTPVSHWAIDISGYSSTQALLLKKMGFKNMLIQKIHYAVKKEFSKRQHLEFRWRQFWDSTGEMEIFTHVEPYQTYGISHSCGPNPSVCSKFDFSYIPEATGQWKWMLGFIRSVPEAVTDENIHELSAELLEQLRKKSMLYKTNALLMPLGDDFSYVSESSLALQFTNYERLFKYMNVNPDMNIKIQFGTLSDYFNSVFQQRNTSHFPLLSGDFFTYSDYYEHYWSGYFTSRPFYKRLERELLHYLRAAEIIFTLTRLSENMNLKNLKQEWELSNFLYDARSMLALFQHHDAIAGTCREHVADDYGEKLFEAIQATYNVILQCTTLLLLPSWWSGYSPSGNRYFDVDDIRYSFDALPQHYINELSVNLRKEVVLFNPLTHSRREVVQFMVDTPYLKIFRNNERVPCQILPVFESESVISTSTFTLVFIVNIPALSLQTYILNGVSENEQTLKTGYTYINVLYNTFPIIKSPPFFKTTLFPSGVDEFSFSNDNTTLTFNNLGLLNAVMVNGRRVPVKVEFLTYISKKSGPYVFFPSHAAEPLEIVNKPLIKIFEGPVLASVTVHLPYVEHTVTLYKTTGADNIGFEIQNTIDIRKKDNIELIMRLITNINSKDEFFTDSNGYQIIRRKWYEKIPIQGNYYPMSTMVYLEDDTTRLTIVSDTPLGCTSLHEGQLEIMMERRILQNNFWSTGDDITDNHVTKETFRVILERKHPECKSAVYNYQGGFPTFAAHVASQTLLFPLIRMLKNDVENIATTSSYEAARTDFGVDYTLASLRSTVVVDGSYGTGIILHRQYFDGCFADRILLQRFPLSKGTIRLSELLPYSKGQTLLRKASLSFLYVQEIVDFEGEIELCPMEIQSYVLFK